MAYSLGLKLVRLLPEWTIMLGPSAGIEKGSGESGLNVADLDIVEINEAFASVAHCGRALELDFEKTNMVGRSPTGTR